MAHAVRSVIGNLDVALVGGAALISKEIVDRATRDLDFFSPVAAPIDEIAPDGVSALGDAGFTVEVRHPGPLDSSR